MHKTDPQLTVIICTYNRNDMIIDCIQSLVNQSVTNQYFNVLVIDNASKDDTFSIVSEYIRILNLTNVRIIQEPKVGLSNARNRGVEESNTAYIAFIDDDARVPQNWVATALEIIDKHNPDIFGGPAYPIFPSGKPEWYKDDYGVRGDMGDTGWLKKGFIIGTNIFFNKSLLIDYGGFDPNLGMKGNTIAYHEETKLVYRALDEGRKVYYSRELAVRDLIPDYKKSLAFFIQSSYQTGKYGLDIFKPDIESISTIRLLNLINSIMSELERALMNRDTDKFPYPENYIVETMKNSFVSLGMWVEAIKRKNAENPGKQ